MGVGSSAAYILSKVLKDVQFSIAAAADRSTQLGGGAGIPTARNDPECEGRRPKTLLQLGCRPAGTSLMSLGRTASCRIASVGHSLTRCTPPCRSEHVG